MGAYSKFRFWSHNVLSGTAGRLGTQRAAIPFSTFSFTRAFCSPEAWSGTIALRAPAATINNLNPGNTAIVAERDGVILWIGLLWSLQVDEGTVRVGGGGWLSAYDQQRRVLNSKAGMTYAETGGTIAANQISWNYVDQFRIVKDMLDHAANYAGSSNVGFKEVRFQGVTGGALSGVTRRRILWDYEKRGILAQMIELADMDNGLDFIPNFGWDTGATPPKPCVYLDLFYPRVGDANAKTTIVEDDHTRITSYAREGNRLANLVWAAGAGAGDAKVFQSADDSGQRYPTGSYPMLEGVSNYNDVQEAGNLYDLAQADLFERAYATETIGVEIREGGGIGVNDLREGDSIKIVARRGSILTINGTYRITDITTAINDKSQATLTLTCVTPGASLGFAS